MLLLAPFGRSTAKILIPSNTAQSLFKPFPCNLLATKVKSFPRKSSNTASPMIACHARDFTWNQGCSSNSPPLTHWDQIPYPLEDSDDQIPSSPGRQRCQMPGVCPGGEDVEASIWPIHYLTVITPKTFSYRSLRKSISNFTGIEKKQVKSLCIRFHFVKSQAFEVCFLGLQ